MMNDGTENVFVQLILIRTLKFADPWLGNFPLYPLLHSTVLTQWRKICHCGLQCTFKEVACIKPTGDF